MRTLVADEHGIPQRLHVIADANDAEGVALTAVQLVEQREPLECLRRVIEKSYSTALRERRMERRDERRHRRPILIERAQHVRPARKRSQTGQRLWVHHTQARRDIAPPELEVLAHHRVMCCRNDEMNHWPATRRAVSLSSSEGDSACRGGT